MSGLAAFAGLAGAPARAATPAPTCVASATSVTCTFTSGDNRFVVPAGVTALHVVAVGGRGGNAEEQAFSRGGRGDVVSAAIVVTPGSAVHAVVGANGEDFNTIGGGVAGLNGGGAGGNCAGGGGGASDVRRIEGDATSRLLVAAGGGGAGCFATLSGIGFFPGGQGGNATQPGGISNGGGGEAGAATAGGAGGAGGMGIGYPDDMPGAPGQHGWLATGGNGGGGAGGGGGGGGGGLYGGGGGGGAGASPGEGIFLAGGGGGGGSDLVPAGGTATLDTSGVPRITISYRRPGTSRARG